MAAVLLRALSLSAGTVMTGFSALEPESPEGFPGSKGAGWAGTWGHGILPAPPGEARIVSDIPLADGGSYLRVVLKSAKADSGIGRTFVRGYGPAAIDMNAAVVFSFRLRLDTDTLGFNSMGDRFSLQSNDQNLYSSSNGSTWIIAASGGALGARVGPMQWLLYDGNRAGGAYTPDSWTSSGMPIVPGAVYSFRIVADPRQRSYDVEIESGGVVVNRQGLGFRTGATRMGSTFGVFGQTDSRNDQIVLSIDDLVISNDLRRRSAGQ